MMRTTSVFHGLTRGGLFGTGSGIIGKGDASGFQHVPIGEHEDAERLAAVAHDHGVRDERRRHQRRFDVRGFDVFAAPQHDRVLRATYDDEAALLREHAEIARVRTNRREGTRRFAAGLFQ
jgi:hypothetical protein